MSSDVAVSSVRFRNAANCLQLRMWPETRQFSADRRERPVFMLRFAKSICVRLIGRIDGLVQQVRKVVIEPRFVRPLLRFDIGRHVPGLFHGQHRIEVIGSRRHV